MTEIIIKEGKVFKGEKQIGTADYDFKYGYHPAVLAQKGDKKEWFEIDDPLQKIVNWFKKENKNASK